MNTWLIVVLAILVVHFVLNFVMEILNLRAVSPEVPKEFQGYYDAEKYSKAQSYLIENTLAGLVKESLSTVILVLFILLGGFNWLDQLCRSFGYGPVLTGLLFGGALFVFLFLFDIPFSLWHTFVIEQKYGFNKTTPRTYIVDKLKGLILGTLLFVLAAGFILWFFEKTGSLAWLYSWGALTAFQILLVFIAPVVIAPLFNKFIPLADGELKTSIEDYARKQDFAMKGVYMMDNSKRSTKSNAYFTGFGKSRRIVLFDTLINRHSVDELVGVLAHEIGHYKKRHITKNILFSMATTLLMFFLLSLFLGNREFFTAFGMQEISTYAGLVFFSFLYTPLSTLLGIVSLHFSRKYEYEADAYAISTSGKREAFVEALKKLSVDNLSNLHPHPMKVLLEYGHPPVLERIRAIEKLP